MAEANAGQAGQPFPIGWNRQTVLDVLFVLVLPIACLALDPGMISRGSYGTGASVVDWSGPGFLYEIQLPLYFLIALVIGGFWLSFHQNLHVWTTTFLRGTLVLGILLTSLFALVLTPFAGLMVFSALGLVSSPFENKLLILAPLGFVPAFTAWRYIRRYRMMPRHKTKFGLAPFGFMTPAVLSLAFYFMIGWTLGPLFQRLQSSEPDVGLAALTDLVNHPLCYSGCRDKVLSLYCLHQARLPAKNLPPLFLGDYGDFLLSEENCAFAW